MRSTNNATENETEMSRSAMPSSSLLSGSIIKQELDDDDDSVTSTSSSSSISTSSNSIVIDTNNEKKKSNKPRVKFANVEMRFYDRILGDNPACNDGPPVSLDWSYSKNVFSTSLDEYETHRLPRRTRRQLCMSTITRRNMMVYHFGYTHEQITAAANNIKRIKKQRAQTKSLTSAKEKRQEIAQAIKGKLKKTLGLNRPIQYESRRNHFIEARETEQINNLCMMVR